MISSSLLTKIDERMQPLKCIPSGNPTAESCRRTSSRRVIPLIAEDINGDNLMDFFDDAATRAYPEMDLLGGAVNAAQQLETVCGALGSSPPAAEIGVPIRSDIPALILAGAFDGQTPPSQAMAVSENLYRGTFVLLPTLGHTQAMRHSCPAGITQAFYAQPLEKPDTTCIRQMQLTFDEPYQVQDDS